MTEKQSFEEWLAHVKLVLSFTSIDADETEEVRLKRVAALEADPEEWFVYYFPQYSFAKPAAFHKEATERILSKKEHYEVRMWSRELAKSTRTMMEALYLMLVGHTGGKNRLKKKYMLLISNSLDNAIRLLMPYRANLQYNERIIQDYGKQEGAGTWQAAEFITEPGASFRALGSGQSPRGTRNEATRPDILLFDDVDTDADCLNPEIVAKKWRWIEEAAIGTRSISQPTTILFCGNRIAIDCCIGRAVSFADHHDVINIRDKDGNSSWPEKNTQTDIDRVLSQKSYAAAQKEYYNNPVTEGAVFKQMAYKPAKRIDEYEHLVCYTDPSYTDSNDYKATVLVGKWQEEYHIIKAYVEQTTTANMISWHLNIKQLSGNARCRFYMEDVFMQDVLRRELNDACAKSAPGLYVNADKRKKQNKYARIEALLEPLHRNGLLYLNEDERHNPHMVRLEGQFTALAPKSSAHDDGPDAVEGAIWLLQLMGGTGKEAEIACFGSKGREYRM